MADKKKKGLLTKIREKIRQDILAGKGKGGTVGSQAKQLADMGLLSEEEQAKLKAIRKKRKNGTK